MVDYFVFGGAVGAAVFASITIAVFNFRSSSTLEAQTGDLIARIQNTLVDEALLGTIRALPETLETLSRAQRLELYAPIRVFSNLQVYEQKVSKIPDEIAWSLVIGVVAGLLAIATGFLYDTSNGFYTLALLLTFLLLVAYLLYGIFPIITIRAVHRANRQLERAITINDAQAILSRTLRSEFNVRLEPLQE